MKPVMLLVLVLLLTQCHWFKVKDPEPSVSLPPETQTGANTFGCYVNGQLWLPKGSVSAGGSNFSIGYDPALSNGFLTISALRKINQTDIQTIGIAIDSVQANKEYILPLAIHETLYSDPLFTYINYQTGCDMRDKFMFSGGKVKIIKLSLEERVIAGTFEFTLYKPGCDTIKITQGRFDKKL